MTLLGNVEEKSWRGRAIHGLIILVLILGGFTMVYPFVVMLTGSVRSEIDSADTEIIPAFWHDDTKLYQKFLETKYNQDVALLNQAHSTRYFSFRNVEVPETVDTAAIARLDQFVRENDLPLHWQVYGGTYGYRTVPEQLRELRQRVSDKYDGDLEAFARVVGVPVQSWRLVILRNPTWADNRYDLPAGPVFDVYNEMLVESDPVHRQLVSISGHFLNTMIYQVYGKTNTQAFNEKHAVPIDDYASFYFPATVPGEDQPQLRLEWTDYVRHELNPSFVVVDGVTQKEYDTFLRDSLGYADEELLPVPDGSQWLNGSTRQAYEAFLGTVPVEKLRVVGPEFEFGQADIASAVAMAEYNYVLENAGALRWAYSVRNYINVFDELVLQGRALINTVIFCSLAIVLSMLINPLAAYAMSRYKLPSTYKILLFLMATMAFPPMVAMIPQFILLRNMNLLNTFVALVLPLVANGYMIFLLKGFFDSLPMELYEAARIDGASETRMFFQITMALSKPILAVLALGTFTGAYMMFLYPLLVAPDQDMWLISVWLFQYQQRSSSPGVYASVVLASIPTLVIFLFAQRTIMRGIVVPTEK